MFGVLLLAAGRSSRMGQPKLLLPWAGTSILGHLLHQWRTLGARQIAVVCANRDDTLGAELSRLCFAAENIIENPMPERGMFSSIQCGAGWRGWVPDLTHWAIVLGDQPHLRLETLTGLLAFAANHSGQVCQPAYRGKAAHPVVLPKPVFQALATSQAETLKEFLSAGEVCRFDCEDSGLELDLDRPEDYQRALALAGLTTR